MSFQTFVTEQLAAITTRLNNLGTNAKTIDELPVQSTIVPTSKIHVSNAGVSESLELQKIIDAVNTGNYDRLISIGEITVNEEENQIIIPSGAIWVIAEVNYSTVSDTTIDVPLAASGKRRMDLLVANTSSVIYRVAGEETTGSITIRPNIPPNTVLITNYDIDDTAIDDPTPPITGYEFVNKSEKIQIKDISTGEIDVHFNDQRAIVSLLGSVTKIRTAETTVVYPCKKFAFMNNQTIDVIIEHMSSAGAENTRFIFPNEENFILKPGEIIEFLFDKTDNYYLRYVGKAQITEDYLNDALQEVHDSLTSEINLKLNITDYNDYFKGVFVSEAALNSALPTGSSGDYAQVNVAGGTDVVNYTWDAEESIWVEGGGSGGAANTDALTEGSTNLYHTSARVLATILTGISFLTSSAVTASDSILVGMGKLQKQITDLIASVTTKLDNSTTSATPVLGDKIIIKSLAASGASREITLEELKDLIGGALSSIEVTEDGHLIVKDGFGNIGLIFSNEGELIFNKLSAETLDKLKTDLGLQNKVKGKKVSILADSIGTITGGGAGISESLTFGGLLRIRDNCAIYRSAVAGTNLATDFTDDARVNSLNSEDEPDLIIVQGGLNDFFEEYPLGAQGDTTTATFYGGLDVLCRKLGARYPNARVCFTNLIHNKWLGSSFPEYNGTNLMTEFSQAIEVVTKSFGYFVVPTLEGSGITCFNIGDLASDNLHGGEEYHEFYYNTVISSTNKNL